MDDDFSPTPARQVSLIDYRWSLRPRESMHLMFSRLAAVVVVQWLVWSSTP